jgi:hypothetical protein
MSSLNAPPLEPQSFDEILSEALARIPVHNPEYTNYQNNTDPGVTILQTFAFMFDNLAYLCNQIPDRNRQKFLSLLGIPMLAPQAANGMVVFANDRGPLQTVTLNQGFPLMAGAVSFVTTNGLDVLPVEARVYLRSQLSPADQQAASQTYTQLYGALAEPNTDLEFYQTVPFGPPTSASSLPVADLGNGSIVDRSVWIAILARQVDSAIGPAVLDQIAGRTLTLGLVPASDTSQKVLVPAAPANSQTTSPLVYEIASGQMNGTSPLYTRLDSRADGNPLTDPTLVQLTLPASGAMGIWPLGPLDEGTGDYPPSLQDQDVSSRVLTWIRVRLPDPSDMQGPSAQDARFNWAGINAAKITQQIPVPVELVGTGTGEPDQTFTLVNAPVIVSTLQVTVNGVQWTQTDDLLAAPSEISDSVNSQVYEIDSQSGVLTFGTGVQGARPVGIISASYSYGGGTAGNVGIGTVNSSPQLPAGFTISNPLPTGGGDAGETLDQAELRIPLYIQHRDRAVSADDFKNVVMSTPGISIARVDVIPLFLPDTGTSAPGVVTVLVVPNDPANPQGPVPDSYFLGAVCDYLDPRRLLTTEVHVVGPDYQDLSVSVGIDVVPGMDIAPVQEAVKQAIRNFLSPTTGGLSGSGWPLQRPVVDRELLAQAARVNGIADINDVSMWDGTGTKVQSLSISGIQLPRLQQVGANLGSPQDLTAVPTPLPSTTKRVPVPVLPATC